MKFFLLHSFLLLTLFCIAAWASEAMLISSDEDEEMRSSSQSNDPPSSSYSLSSGESKIISLADRWEASIFRTPNYLRKSVRMRPPGGVRRQDKFRSSKSRPASQDSRDSPSRVRATRGGRFTIPVFGSAADSKSSPKEKKRAC